MIEVRHIVLEDPLKMPFPEDQKVVETLPADTAQESFAK
jgi:hypothetical protein